MLGCICCTRGVCNGVQWMGAYGGVKRGVVPNNFLLRTQFTTQIWCVEIACKYVVYKGFGYSRESVFLVRFFAGSRKNENYCADT